MAKVKNVSGEDRTVPLLGGLLVLAGQIVEVDEAHAEAFVVQTDVWASADAAPKNNQKGDD
jgi:hypothetical protein